MEVNIDFFNYSFMHQLGKLEKIEDLRSIWKHEAKDFTPWLAEEENLSMLSEAILRLDSVTDGLLIFNY